MVTGELAPDLWGRTDTAKYQSGLKKARGVMFNKRGALMNMPGTEVVMPAKFPGDKHRQIPFKISFNQQYTLFLGDYYMHFAKNGEPIFNFASALEITAFPAGVNPTLTIPYGSATTPAITSTNLANGMMCQLQQYGGEAFLNDTPIASGDFALNLIKGWYMVNIVSIGMTSTTITLTDLFGNALNTTGFGTYNTNLAINTVYEIETPYANGDVNNINFAQSFDIMQLRHKSYIPQEVLYFSDTNWLIRNKNYWPSLAPAVVNLQLSGGDSGQVSTYYQVSTYELTSQQESFPGTVGGSAVISSFLITALNIAGSSSTATATTASAHGFSSGDQVTFNNYAPPYSGPANYIVIPGTVYTITVTGATTFTFTGSAFNPGGSGSVSYPSGFAVQKTSGTTTTTIVSISSGNPMVLQVTNHGLQSGTEVLITGTGVYGLDNVVFVISVIDANHYSLNGVDGANYSAGSYAGGGNSASTIIIAAGVIPDSSHPITLTWNISSLVTPANLTNYVFKVYRASSPAGPYGFIGFSNPGTNGSTTSFIDSGIPPDSTLTPKGYIPLFIGSGNYPASCNYYQQRLVEMATDDNPQGLWASVVGDYNDFSVHNPIQENDAVLMNIWSTELSEIFSSADDGFLILMTDMGPMVAAGDSSGLFSPGTNLVKRYMFAGAAQQPRPLAIFKDVLYVEASQASIRSLEILVTPYYTYISKSDDISLFSQHLLTVSPIKTWDYKLYPDSQIFSVREDGVMIMTSYLPEQQINAFSWVDTEGSWLDVACIQEGKETFAYATAQRGNVAWLERFASRYYTDPTIDAIFTHATASYDGLVNDGTTAVLSGILDNGQIDFGATFTATLSNNNVTPPTNDAANFQTGWVVAFKDASGNIARMKVTGTTSTTVTGTAMEAFVGSMLGETISDIRVQTYVMGGLSHLNGMQVSVVADGQVIANPNDNAYPVMTVQNGQLTFTNNGAPQYFGVINVGLPYYSDVQTLDIDNHQGETYIDKLKAVKRVTLKLYNSGEFQAGPDFTENLQGNQKMDSPKYRQNEGYLSPTGLFTGIISLPVDAHFDYSGSIAIRNRAPLPLTILDIAPLMEVQT